MIARLVGEVVARDLHAAVVDCRGLGFHVAMTEAALARLTVGQTAQLHVHTVIGQAEARLFGFLDLAERAAFVVLIGVAGVGPRLAMALLSELGAEGLRASIAAGDVVALKQVAGVGRRTAERLLVELAGRLDEVVPLAAAPVAADLHSALCNVGFEPKVAREAARRALAEGGGNEPLPSLMRRALRLAAGTGVEPSWGP